MTRRITTAEAAVVDRVLRVSPLIAITEEIFSSIVLLQVTASCDCGCATVWFGPAGSAASGKIMAEGHGSADGLDIDIIVWSQESVIIGLELVGAGAIPLPDPGSIKPHDVA